MSRPRWDETPKAQGVRVHADPETDPPHGPLSPRPSVTLTPREAVTAAAIAFSDAAHGWIEGQTNAGQWMAAQKGLADALGISLDVLNDIERSRRQP